MICLNMQNFSNMPLSLNIYAFIRTTNCFPINSFSRQIVYISYSFMILLKKEKKKYISNAHNS